MSIHSMCTSSRICSALMEMLMGGDDEWVREKVGPQGEPAVKWIGSGFKKQYGDDYLLAWVSTEG